MRNKLVKVMCLVMLTACGSANKSSSSSSASPAATPSQSAPSVPAQWLPCGPFIVVPANGSDSAQAYDFFDKPMSTKIPKHTVADRTDGNGPFGGRYKLEWKGDDVHIRAEDIVDTCPKDQKTTSGYMVARQALLTSGNQSCEVAPKTLIKIKGHSWDGSEYLTLTLSEALPGCSIMSGKIHILSGAAGDWYFGTPTKGHYLLAELKKAAGK